MADDEILEQLNGHISALRELLPKLQAAMAEQPGLGPSEAISRNKPESKEPWSTEAAHAYWDIFFGSRYLADDMRIAVGLYPYSWSTRGGDGFDEIAAMAPAVDRHMLVSAQTQAGRWVRLGQSVRDIDLVDLWVPLPRRQGGRSTACPYCETYSLRLDRSSGDVKCLFPGCADGDGRATHARLSHVTDPAGWMLVFDDDTRLLMEAVDDSSERS